MIRAPTPHPASILKPWSFPQPHSWQCEHCTFRNKSPGRVCEMCNRTSQRAGLEPILLHTKAVKEEEAEEEEGRCQRGPPVVKAEPQSLWKSLPISQEEAEHRRQEKLRQDGQKMVAMIRVSHCPAIFHLFKCLNPSHPRFAYLECKPCVYHMEKYKTMAQGDVSVV